MQVTEAKIPAVFIYKSDGEALAAAEDKIITLSKEQHKVIDYEMSEFSSWGATSALTLKPEITAPGGNIYSSLSIDENGGSVYGYNSGTSMASPNAAGGLTLIRQRINELYPDLSAKERLALTYKTAMSTAEIRKDADGRVYSPRKQGAGLLDVAGAIQTKAYISVKGTDRAKIELGDDPERIGIYTLDFDVVNLSEEELRYTVDVIALTEALEEKDGKSFFALASETLGREFSISVEDGGRKEGEFGIIVEGGKSLSVSVSLVLTEEAREFLEKAPKGNFVEGFITLESEDEIGLSLPYMGFYGDWTDAKAFEYDYFDENSDLVQSFPIILSGYYMTASQTASVYYLGTYAFETEGGKTIEAEEKRIALSAEGGGVFSVDTVYFGLLKNMDYVTVSVRDAYTGEVLYEVTEEKLNKSVYNSSYDAIIPQMMEYGFRGKVDKIGTDKLPNNARLIVRIEGKSEFEALNGREPKNGNVVEMPLTVDNEAPQLLSARLYKENGRLFYSVDVYDNQYVMAVTPLFMQAGKENSGIQIFDYMTPVLEEEAGAITKLVWDITDYEEDIKAGVLGVGVYDYALNRTIAAAKGLTAPADWQITGVIFGQDEIVLREGEKIRAEYLSEPFGRDVFLAYGGKITEIFASMNPSVASVDENGLITAKKEGSTEIFVTLRAENSCGEITTHIAKCSVKVAGRIADGMASFSDDGNDFVIEDGVLVKYNGKESRVVIPEGVRVIGASAFYGNKTIKTIEIREGLEGIASRAFMNSSITEITLPASIKTVGESAFESCLCKKAVFILGEAEVVIGKSAFRNSALESLVLSDNVAEIGEKAFAGCKLRTVNLPESLRILGNEAFCDAITDVKDFVLPENIEYLGDKSLAQTKIIAEELIIPEDCTYVGANVFYEGSKVSAVRLPASVEKIDFGKHQFINNYSGIYHISDTHPFLKVDCGAIIDYAHNVYLRCVSLPDDGKITIPDGIIRIGERAFAYVPVKSVAVPESVATIGDEAFRVEGVKIFFGGKLPLLETYDTKGRYFNFKNAEIYVAEGISVPMSYISQSENSMTELTSAVKELLKKEERTIEIKKLNEKIANLVVTSLENKTEIQDIRDKYDALSEDEKLLVDNYYKLILAEKDLILLEKDAENVDYKGQISNLEELCDELESAIEKLNGEIGEAKKLSDEDEKIISELKEALASTRDEIEKISVEKSQMRTSFIVALIIVIVILALSIVIIMKKKKK